eukprot:TRINITY_DN12815_c0_g1_i1.p1 TRINITY_DN12815_c0_g1~~TRINITY_DN12815_c0_g1_i1.p1  ORF type:complete len:362 (+),score=71.69 TRINITY_DN12815_c0_g1_i1:42-1127(+)
MALKGIRVLEFAGLAPGPFAGMMLSDFGAEVIRIDRKGKHHTPAPDVLARGKKSVTIDLKSEEGKSQVKALVKTADVVIEPFRPGVMEKLGLGPDILCSINPRLIYARITGFGQGGLRSTEHAAGHDINYLATSGVLSALRQQGRNPTPPVNILADFAGGGAMCAFGIVVALLERTKSNKGQVIDAAMVDGAAYLGTFISEMVRLGSISNTRNGVGTTMLDGGAPFYQTYETKDGEFFSVGAIEPQFYKSFIKHLSVTPQTSQHDRSGWPAMRKLFSDQFLTKTRSEWEAIFEGTDSCAFPVLNMAEAASDKHNQLRNTFYKVDSRMPIPQPAPKLSRTPGVKKSPYPVVGEANNEFLSKL